MPIESCFDGCMLLERLHHGKLFRVCIHVSDPDLVSQNRLFPHHSTSIKPFERNITNLSWQVVFRYVILNFWWAVVIGPCTGKGLTSAPGRQGMIA